MEKVSDVDSANLSVKGPYCHGDRVTYRIQGRAVQAGFRMEKLGGAWGSRLQEVRDRSSGESTVMFLSSVPPQRREPGGIIWGQVPTHLPRESRTHWQQSHPHQEWTQWEGVAP